MHLYDCKVRLGGDVQNEVRKRSVTAAELMVLRELPGEDAVIAIEQTGGDKRSHAEERQRIYRTYAAIEDNVGGYAEARLATLRALFGPDHLDLPVKLEGDIPTSGRPAAPKRT